MIFTATVYSPNSACDTVLLDRRFLGLDTENVRIVFRRIYLQVGREIWITHGNRNGYRGGFPQLTYFSFFLVS